MVKHCLPGSDDCSPDYSCLRQLGCSRLAIACYRSLCEDGGATASTLADRLNKESRNSLYDVLAGLRTACLVTTYYHGGWSWHEAVPLEAALIARHRQQRQAVGEIIEYQQLRAAAKGC